MEIEYGNAEYRVSLLQATGPNGKENSLVGYQASDILFRLYYFKKAWHYSQNFQSPPATS